MVLCFGISYGAKKSGESLFSLPLSFFDITAWNVLKVLSKGFWNARNTFSNQI